jgi:hypothetical protein
VKICAELGFVGFMPGAMSSRSTNMPEEKIDIALEGAKAGGVTNILALRGGGFVRVETSMPLVFP